MEALILKALGFNLLSPTIHTFLQRYLTVAEAEQAQVGFYNQVENDPNLPTQQCSGLAMVSFLLRSQTLFKLRHLWDCPNGMLWNPECCI